MDDLKLQLLAAKAAGLEVRRGKGHQSDMLFRQVEDSRGIVTGVEWSPLKDDGDALRLASHLRLKVLPGKHKGDGCTVESQQPGIAGCTAFRDDPAEQMRIAIVRVAAETGAAMASVAPGAGGGGR